MAGDDMSEPTSFDFPSADGLSVAAYRWDPQGDARAIAQITHGVGEYAERYAPLAGALTERGFVVYGHDHRAHGASVLPGSAFGKIGESGWTELVSDIGRMGAVARMAHPSLPLVLIAHSLGSFATQQYLLDHSADVDAVVLSGTAALDLLEPALDLDAPMDLTMFNAAFNPPRTAFDWLSRDEGQVDRYIADPRCGFGLDIPGAKAMFVGARQLSDPARLAKIRNDLPVYIVVGEMDPVNGQLTLVNVVVSRLTDAGVKDVTLTVYPGARHEVFNETNREEVFADMIAWMDDKVS
jgi:alpha-beta hydrolase superfamily lysophospholipase